MLKFRKLTYRPWPVKVLLQICDEATGLVTPVEYDFIGHFKPFSEADHEAARKLAEEKFPMPEDAAEGYRSITINLQRNAVIFSQLMCGWGPQVQDDQGQPLPYSEAALCDLVTGPDGIAVSTGIHTALQQLRFGIAPEKNFETSPSPGQSTAAGEVATNLQTT